MLKPASRTARHLPLVLSLSAVFCSVAVAQTESSPDDPLVLSEFVVTSKADVGYKATNSLSATRVAIAIRDLPADLQVITEEFMRDIGAIDLKETLAYTTTFQQTIAPFGIDELGAFAVRGFTNNFVLRDGFRRFNSGDAVAMARVEVVGGPASLLYGQSQPGGVVNYVTKTPLAKFAASLRQIVGSYDFYRTEVDVSVPAATPKGISLRVMGSYVDRGSFIDYDVNEKRFGRGVLEWKPGAATTVRVAAEYTWNQGTPPTRHPLYLPTPAGAVFGVGFVDLPRSFSYVGPYARNDYEFWNVDGIVEHRFNEHVTNRFIYTHSDRTAYLIQRNGAVMNRFGAPVDGKSLGLNLTITDNPVSLNDFFENDTVVKFATGALDHQVLLGLEYAENESGFIQYANTQAIPVVNVYTINTVDPKIAYSVTDPATYKVTSDNTFNSTSKAVVLTDHIAAFNSRLHLLGGLRYDKFYQRNYNNITKKVDQVFDVEATSPQVGASFKVARPVSLYALYATSFVQNTTVDNLGHTFDPTVGKSYEFGSKYDLIEGKLSGAVVYFDIRKTGVVRTNPLNASGYDQSGEEGSKGVEAHFLYTPFAGYQATVSYTLADAKVISNSNDVAQNGRPLAGVSKHSFSFWNKYAFGKGSLKGLFIGAGAVYASDAPYSVASNLLGVELPESWTVNAVMGYQHRGEKYNYGVNLNLNNLLDEYHIQQGGVASAPFTARLAVTVGF